MLICILIHCSARLIRRDYHLKMDRRPDDQILAVWLFSSMFTFAMNDGSKVLYLLRVWRAREH